MRVLHILGELRASGAEVMLLQAVPTLRSHGVDTTIVGTGERVGAFAPRFEGAGADVLHLPFVRSPRFALAFARLVRAHRPDVIHVHTERANAVLGTISRASGARCVRTIHNNFAYEGRLRRLRIAERAWLRAIGVRHIAIGSAVADNERSRLNNATIRIDNWIGDGFRPPSPKRREAARRRYGLDQATYAIVSVGNCSPVKNHEAILRALPGLRDAVGQSLLYLHAGTGAWHEERERDLVRECRLEGNVRFLGSVDDVRELLWAADAYCMPSRYEGVSIAALEALACGLPAVLADVPGLREVAAAGPSVRFVTPTPDGVAEGIVYLNAGDREGLRAEGKRVADRIVADRALATQVARLVDLYENRRGAAAASS